MCGEGFPRRGRDTAANGCRRPLTSDTRWEEDGLEVEILHRKGVQQDWWLHERRVTKGRKEGMAMGKGKGSSGEGKNPAKKRAVGD